MNDRTYTFRDLIQAFIAARRQYSHKDFADYHRRRFEVLQDLFAIHFASDDVRQELPAGIRPQGALMVFSSTVDSFLAIRTPWSGFLEGGLGVAVLAKMYGDPFVELAKRSEQAHMELLETLFTLLYGQPKEIFTSNDLLQAGFDDTAEWSLRPASECSRPYTRE